MNLVEWLQHLMTNFGAAWVMWLMIALSVASVTIMLERGWFYLSIRDDIQTLSQALRERLRDQNVDGTITLLEKSPSAEAAVVVAGLREADRGVKAADKAMRGAAALQKMKLERRLAFLGTLGNNAPFIGLFGTVIGVVQAFEQLGKQGMGSGPAQAASAAAPTAVMSAIAEALVATAVGLAVAIPAVAAYNFYQRHTRWVLGNTDVLTNVLLSHLSGDDKQQAPSGGSKAKSKADDDEDD
jgi:biopolymer transport protein ExbB/TolQ